MWGLSRRRQGADAVTQESVALLAKQIHAVGLKLQEYIERLEALEAAHERLRGRFYAAKGPSAPPAPQTKAEILREFGFVPGQPAPHR